LSSLFQLLGHADRALLEAGQELRWGPLTALFLIASAWWVKGLVFVSAGGVGDLSARRRFPLAAGCAAMSFAVASLLVFLLKDLVDRARPAVADPAVQPLVATPHSPSFPSGHTAAAFAAAAVVGSFHPRLRLPLHTLAALVAVSRVYLGVHYWLDVLAGAALGLAVGLAAVWASRRIACRLSTRTSR
jgi:membrane-associated phospholipid phosphatase